MKVLLLAVVCMSFLGVSGMTAANAVETTYRGTIIAPQGETVKQGWSCSKAKLYYRIYGASFSWLKRANGYWLKCYDDMQEEALRGASDNYSVVCVYYSGSGWSHMYTY